MAIATGFSNYISRRTGSPQAVVTSVTITGLADTLLGADEKRALGPVAQGRALYAEALLVMRESKRLTPVRYGFLRASGHVAAPQIEGRRIFVEMGFGGPAGVGNVGETNGRDVGYALPVHENVAAHHTVGQAKYLEAPLLAAIPGMEARLATRIREELRL